MSVQTGTGQLATALAEALGLPRSLKSFELRVALGEVISCKAVIYLDAIDGGAFKTALVDYVLVAKEAGGGSKV